MPVPSLLHAENLAKSYHARGLTVKALDEFTFSVHSGERIGLLGPNGAGKTTLVKAVTLLTTIDAGCLSWESQPIVNRQYLKSVGVLLEGRGVINERLSPFENASYLCGLKQIGFDRQYFERLTTQLGINQPYRPMRTLSTGNKLRCSILCALIHRPSLIFLDEPTNGLDTEGADRLEQLIKQLSEKGTAFVIASHDLDFVERLCSRVVCISSGAKVYDGPQNDFRRIDHAISVTMTPGITGLPELPQPWAWTFSEGRAGEIRVSNHEELCKLLSLISPFLTESKGLRIETMTLRDKYNSLLRESVNKT